MYKILLLTDYSDASRQAIVYTQQLFADTPVDFCLLNAFPVEAEVAYGLSYTAINYWQLAQDSIVELRQEVEKKSISEQHTFRIEVLPGGPINALEVQLSREPFDLVVVGATGSGISERLGSVATGVVRHATTNVLVVPATATAGQVEQVVLATDYQPATSALSFALLKDIVARKKAQLTLLHVEADRKAAPVAEETIRQYLLSNFAGIKIETATITDEDVLQGMNHYLDACRVDMLVMLPHHKSIWDVLLGNSLTRSIAYHPRVPLLTLYDRVVEPVQQEAPQEEYIPFLPL
ncbi:universal stress protein [Telluribacter sp. SYSU D00476]|uniref:universal stress protein n=1 Tax=Telluribacter sp. SYSU D00476 TaxID=2811430 RepID=UPI001FF3EF75|nr:universal stress protein [Telluribacter sp. SYSU D00476]